MRVEGDVPLELIVWLSGPEAEPIRLLAEAAPAAEWHVEIENRMRLKVRGGMADVEPRAGKLDVEGRGSLSWMGLFTGRVQLTDVVPPSDKSHNGPFRQYAADSGDPPLRLSNCWFAADLDGRVACFDRGQLGAAPKKRCWGPRPEPPLRALPPIEQAAQLADRHANGKLPARAFTFTADARELASALARGAPPAMARRWSLTLVDAARVVVAMPPLAPMGPHAEPLSHFAMQWLHVRGVCAGCARAAIRDPRLRGAYLYENRVRTRAMPYERVGEPNAPWSVAEAAAALGLSAEGLSSTVLPVRFSDKDRLQPVEYVPCTWSEQVSWESEAGERHGR